MNEQISRVFENLVTQNENSGSIEGKGVMITRYYLVISVERDELRYIPVDPLSDRLNLFICSRDMSRGVLRDFFSRNQPITTRIRDEFEIEKNIRNVHRELRYDVRFAAFKESVSKLVSPFKMSVGDFSLSVSQASANRKPSDNKTLNGNLVYIQEDNIQPSKLVELASLYEDLPSQTRPLLFFEPKNEDLSLLDKFRGLKSNIKVTPIGQARNWRTEINPVNAGAFIENFLSHAYTACETAEDSQVSISEFSTLHPEKLIYRLASESLVIKTYDAMGNKFSALPIALKLLEKIDVAKEYMKSDRQLKYLMSLRAIVNLWVAFIDESRVDAIDNSLAIAEYLGNKYLKAHCQRLSHLVSGYSTVTRSMVSEAVKYFRNNEDHEAYVYSQTNLLLNQLHTGPVDTSAFEELAAFAVNETPYLDRLSTILNNAGTAFLISGRLKEAMECYEQGSNYSGQNIHHLGLDINKMIVRHMDGDTVGEDEVIKLHSKIARANLPKQYAYHQSYIHWNLLNIAGKKSDAGAFILEYLKNKAFMEYDDVVSGKESMVDFLANTMILNKGSGSFSGVRGEFIHRTQLFPIIHFQWM